MKFSHPVYKIHPNSTLNLHFQLDFPMETVRQKGKNEFGQDSKKSLRWKLAQKTVGTKQQDHDAKREQIAKINLFEASTLEELKPRRCPGDVIGSQLV